MAASKEALTDSVPGRQENIYCQPCSRNKKDYSAAKYCLDCEEYQCADCVKAHQLFPVTRGHSLIDLCNMGHSVPKCGMKNLIRCKQHDRRLEFFCEDDNVPCCSKCVVIDHKTCHRIEDIETIAGQKQTNWTGMQQDLTDIETKAQKIVEHVKDQRTALTVGSNDIQSKIQTMQDKVNQLFDNLKKTASAEIATFQENTFRTLGEMETTCQSLVSKAEEIRCGVNDISQLGTPVQQLIFARHVTGLIADLEKSLDVLNEEMKEVKLSFEFEDSLKLPPAEQPFWRLSVGFEKRKR